MSLIDERTANFYAWETRGRGWLTFPHAVVLEPTFKPFPGHLPARPIVIDDARKPTLLSALVEHFKPETPTGFLAAPAEEPVVPEPFERSGELREYEILVPIDEKIDASGSLDWLRTIGATSGPITFELVAAAERVTIRVAADERDAVRVRDHLRSMFPRVVVRQAAASTAQLWNDCGDGVVGGMEFALRHEFMLPLNAFSRGTDPFTPILAVLGRVKLRELAILQVMFEPVRSPWAAHALVAVQTPYGEPFFEDGKEVTSLALEKCSQALYAAVIRTVVSAATRAAAEDVLFGIATTLELCGSPARNEFIPRDTIALAELIKDVLDRTTHRSGMLLSLSDLAALVHLPSQVVRSDCLVRPSTRTKAALPIADNDSFILGLNDHDGETRTVGLSTEARLRHSYVIGASGTGKSTLLLSMIAQDIDAGNGFAVLDPHGDLIDDVLARIPEERTNDVVLLDPSDEAFPVGFNILSAHSELERSLLSSDLVGVFKRLSTSFGDQMIAVLGNAILAFLESTEGGTLLDLRRFLLDKRFRSQFLKTVQDREVVLYWKQEFPLLRGSPHAPILTRLNTFLRPKLIRYMVAQKEGLDLRAIMDGRKILLAKLSQGAIGEENSHLLGSLLVAKLAQAAMSRQDAEVSTRVPYFLYIDEFHHFVTPSIATILSGARKYGLGLTLAHQEMRQLKSRSEDVAGAVLANAYTRVVFRVGEHDAKALADGFSFFEAKDLQNLGIGEAIARVERPEFDFSLRTVPLPRLDTAVADERRSEIIVASRATYASPRAEIESQLNEGYEQQEAATSAASDAPTRKRRAATPATTVPADSATPANRSLDQPLPGRGGPQHKYLQSLVRRLAEDRGFTVSVEKMILDGHGHVDVHLQRGDLTVGCEISVTTRVDHEVGNLTKCLAAGYRYAILVSSDPDVLDAARATYVASDRTRVRFLAMDGLTDFLDGIDAPAGRKTEDGGPRFERSRGSTVAREPIVEPRSATVRLTAQDAAKYLGIAMQTLAKMRWNGTSPVFHKVGRQVVYDQAELDAWMAKRRRRSTSDPGCEE